MTAAAPLVLGQDASPSWSGEAGLSYVQRTGNSDSSTFGAGLKLFREDEPWRMAFATAFIRTETDDVKSAERFDASLRGERGLGPRFALYSQGSYLRNIFAGIDGQEIFELGGLYELVKGPRHALAVSTALAYTAEQRLEPNPDRNFAGVRAGLAYKFQISSHAEFTEDASYLQSFESSADGRVTHRAALTASINDVFALKLVHDLLYLRDPVPGKKGADNTILASIVAKWPAPKPPVPMCPCAPN